MAKPAAINECWNFAQAGELTRAANAIEAAAREAGYLCHKGFDPSSEAWIYTVSAQDNNQPLMTVSAKIVVHEGDTPNSGIMHVKSQSRSVKVPTLKQTVTDIIGQHNGMPGSLEIGG